MAKAAVAEKEVTEEVEVVAPSTRNCVRCQVSFTPNTIRQRFCNRACKDKSPRLKPQDYPDNCSFSGCVNPFYANSLCKSHNLQRWAGKELYPLKYRMPYDSNYRKETKEGYVEVYKPTHANAQKGGKMMEHIYVMSEYLGRPLTVKETVHHINLNKADNRIENLQLRQGNHGSGAVFVCADCHSTNVIAVPLAKETQGA